MLSTKEIWLLDASHPHLPIHSLLSVPSALVYNAREAPCSSLGVSGRSLGAHLFCGNAAGTCLLKTV